MYKELDNYNIIAKQVKDSLIYEFKNDDNVFLVVSNQDSRELLLNPEVIGYDFNKMLKHSTKSVLHYLNEKQFINNVNILTILRGGLNFPIEESCFELKIPVDGVSFISSERRFDNSLTPEIENNYNKIYPINNSTIIIGDIVASSATLHNAIKLISDAYIELNKQPKNIIVFTIGTINVFNLLESINKKLKNQWPLFNNIIFVFYEGIFNVFNNTGTTKLNIPNVDFYINNAFIAPMFRNMIAQSNSYIYERCIIYDGGERRFNPIQHIKTLLNYWDSLLKVLPSDYKEIITEKYGYDNQIDFNTWLENTGYDKLDDNISLFQIYNQEMKKITNTNHDSCMLLCKERQNILKNYYNKLGYFYEKNT